MFSLRAIRNIVLRKGGKSITLITYGPFNKIRYVDTPLRNVRLESHKDALLKILNLKL